VDFVLKNEPGQLPYLYLPGFGEGKVRAVFTTRRGGVSKGPYSSLNLGYHTGDDPDAVTANRRLVTDALNIEEDRLITLNQIHSDRLVVLEREEDLLLKKGSSGDGLITHLSNVAISILCADCQAIYLYDPCNRVIAVAHAGWRGAVAKIAASCLQEMSKVYGSRPVDCYAALSPAAGPCCYEVGEDVYQAIQEAFPEAFRNLLEEKGNGKWFFNISQSNCLVLQDAGVLRENISISSFCTICRQDLFFSYRGSQGETGRMAAILIQ